MKPTLHLFALSLLGLLLAACHETADDNTEFSNWQERNESYFQQKYLSAVNGTALQDKIFVLTKWSFNDSITTKAEDHIVVEVLEEGTGSGCPLFTDSVRVHFRGHTIPTNASPDGYVIGSSYEGTFYEQTAQPRTLSVSASTTVDGLATALQRMHIGDRWRITIPYQLGYSIADYTPTTTTGWISVSVPAYTTLIYDVKLVGYYRH